MAKGYYPYHKLTAADFPINDTVYRQFAMHTVGFFHWTCRGQWIDNNGHAIARVAEWRVWSGFDRNKSSRKSWLTHIAETLQHEQIHLDIVELHIKRLADTPIDKLPIGEGTNGSEAKTDLTRKMKSLGNRVAAEAQAEQDRYDAETNHGQ